MHRTRFLIVSALAVAALLGPAVAGAAASTGAIHQAQSSGTSVRSGWLCGPYGDAIDVIGIGAPDITTTNSTATIYAGDRRSDHISCHFNHAPSMGAVTQNGGYCSYNQFDFRNRLFRLNGDGTADLYCWDARDQSPL